MEFLTLLDPGPDAGLAALFVASFLAATILPGGSEAVFAGLVSLHPGQANAALVLATVGNTLGGMSTYLLARLFPQAGAPERLAWLQRHGAPALILAWAPLVGDALCAAAGWLRLAWLPCLGWMALGKALRYSIILALLN
ncbi:MAG: DedA family protein [Ottowia sp.]|nr:DedA family protein [Ottowia sp.]